MDPIHLVWIVPTAIVIGLCVQTYYFARVFLRSWR